jgi:hypothetical protein
MFQFYSSLVYMSRLLLHACWVLFKKQTPCENTKTYKETQSQDVTRAINSKSQAL